MIHQSASDARILTLVMTMLVAGGGCFPIPINDPGGGTVHVPPSFIPAGQPFTVVMECIAISGGTERRFRDGVLHYRQAGTVEYSDIPMKLVLNAGKRPAFTGDLPSMEAGVSVEYYVSYVFDGERRKRYFPAVPVAESQLQ
ncbi:MAG TPA: hypothetical protein VM165_12485 [Planctomycetaceae bacterium]|nr:hypothetical protein [Planctomycetaceae bacterium]